MTPEIILGHSSYQNEHRSGQSIAVSIPEIVKKNPQNSIGLPSPEVISILMEIWQCGCCVCLAMYHQNIEKILWFYVTMKISVFFLFCDTHEFVFIDYLKKEEESFIDYLENKKKYQQRMLSNLFQRFTD